MHPILKTAQLKAASQRFRNQLMLVMLPAVIALIYIHVRTFVQAGFTPGFNHGQVASLIELAVCLASCFLFWMLRHDDLAIIGSTFVPTVIYLTAASNRNFWFLAIGSLIYIIGRIISVYLIVQRGREYFNLGRFSRKPRKAR
jgi:hypothetical protein